jgi:hypothetical protein
MVEAAGEIGEAEMRTTHTYAVLDISPAAFREIAEKLKAAGYGHAFHEEEGRNIVDMQGIAVAEEAHVTRRAKIIHAIRLWRWRRAVLRHMRRRWDCVPSGLDIRDRCWTDYFDDGYDPLETVMEEEDAMR